ncbi:MAG: hypothetical protein KDA53_00125 [Hyphomonas sp.]|nr:hypothetical protein [Hyphomonas sp.]
MYRILMLAALAFGLSQFGQPALAQTASENSARIEELEAQINALRAQNEKLAELVQSLTDIPAASEAPIEPVIVLTEDRKIEPSALTAFLDKHADKDSSISAIATFKDTAATQKEPIPAFVDGSFGTARRSKLSEVGISASNDNGRVAIGLSSSSFNAPDCALADGDTVRVDDRCLDQTTRYQQYVTTASLSVPTNKNGDTDFATLDGLATGTKAELRYTTYFGTVPRVRDIYSNVPRALAKCIEANPGKEEACVTLDGQFLKDYMESDERTKFAKYVFDNTVANSYGVTFSGSIGYDKYPYFPDTQFKKEETERVSGSIGAGLIYFPDHGTSFSFEGQYQHTFKAADAATRCRTDPDPGNDFLTCATGAFEKPSKANKFILAPQYRKVIKADKSDLFPRVAVAPRFEYDLLSNDFAFDVPIYLVADKDDGMVAGIRLGFEDKNDEEDVKFGVFYGKAFDLTPF